MRRISVGITAVLLTVLIVSGTSLNAFAGTTTILPGLIEGLSVIREAKKFINEATGIEIFDSVELVCEGQAGQIVDAIGENTPVDFRSVIATFPSIRTPAFYAGEVFGIDTKEVRDRVLEAGDWFHDREINAPGDLLYFFTAFLGKIDKYELTLTSPEKPERCGKGSLEFLLILHYSDGGKSRVYTGAYYDPETGMIYGSENKGLCHQGYNYDADDFIVYAALDCWMRNYGFCVEYDILANLTTAYNFITRRFRFWYGGKEWLIQAWKGNYSVTNGAEVGVYNRHPMRFGTLYDCISDEELMPMSMSLYHGKELIVSVDEQSHWWINAFKMTDELYDPREMTLYFTIEMPDKGMLDAFCKAIDRNIYGDVSYKADGLKVIATW